MRIFKQIGFVFIIIALALLFQRYPTVGAILAIVYVGRRIFRFRKKSSKKNARELHQINQNLERLNTILSTLLVSRLPQSTPPESSDDFYREERTNSSSTKTGDDSASVLPY